jgi:hypothetical protein
MPPTIDIRGRRWVILEEHHPHSSFGLHIIVCASRIDGDSSDDGLIQVQKFERTSKRLVWREARHRKDASVRTYLSRRAIKLLAVI